ncbi:MAG: bifunctional (p)ppGpp synthetase/guanosine-3',5'-bis(diphosphate) 3'-pyrophosphohydrolase [Oscillospiraceae bacterium]|nr:bifunctional (p)ppGpp synthetase/guanosine-3',5'-bis(diphosphate) 3'-pyrophosphohydrolase [Oscillospiraceae bacterium]
MEGLLSDIEKSEKQYDTEIIKDAYSMAKEAHSGQKRESGEDYITHPVTVAKMLIELGMDVEAIAAALLHDVVEDTDVTLEDIRKKFGDPVADLVDGVTKLTKLNFSTKEEQQAENVRKMLLAMAKDVRVIIIKLADRLHNMRTMSAKCEEKRREKALETMEVYAPIAHRLGIYTIKEELEDTAISYLDPIAYEEINARLASEKEDRIAFLQSIKNKLYDRIKPEYPNVYIEGRVKSIYGIYQKVYMKGRAFEEIYDIYAVRIIVDSVNECYNILGIIHDIFTPIPNRFKDYISTPKQNMYRSLHTTVIDKGGIPFEIQIRTWDMHHNAEYGIASHWKYKEGKTGSSDKLDERLLWIRQLLEAQKESDDVQDIVLSIKSDLSPEEVFVFTPKGEVKSLPLGATVIDFAYAIHSEVGNKMTGAKVDGKIVPLNFQVKTGMIVEILTSNVQGRGPSRDWLNIVKTSEARNKIRSWYKKEKREENIIEGKAETERELKRNGIDLDGEEYENFVNEIAKRQKYGSTEEFYAAIGYGGMSLTKIMPRVKEEYLRQYKQEDGTISEKIMQNTGKERKISGGVVVEGLNDCLVKYARCCNPIPGDEIIGFITRGNGVSIHKKDCENALRGVEEQKERWVKAKWEIGAKETYNSTVEIYADNRNGLLADLSVTLTNSKVPIHSFSARETKDNKAVIEVTFGVTSVEQLNIVISNFKKVSGVNSITRKIK